MILSRNEQAMFFVNQMEIEKEMIAAGILIKYFDYV